MSSIKSVFSELPSSTRCRSQRDRMMWIVGDTSPAGQGSSPPTQTPIGSQCWHIPHPPIPPLFPHMSVSNVFCRVVRGEKKRSGGVLNSSRSIDFLSSHAFEKSACVRFIQITDTRLSGVSKKHQLCSVCEMLSRWAEGGLKGAGCRQVSLSVACQRRENCHRKMQTTPIEYP